MHQGDVLCHVRHAVCMS